MSNSRRIPVPGVGLAWASIPLALFAVLGLWLPLAATVWKAYAAFLVLLCGLDFVLRPAKGSVRVERILADEYRVVRRGGKEI